MDNRIDLDDECLSLRVECGTLTVLIDHVATHLEILEIRKLQEFLSHHFPITFVADALSDTDLSAYASNTEPSQWTKYNPPAP